MEWSQRVTGEFFRFLGSKLDCGEVSYGALDKVVRQFEQEVERHIREVKSDGKLKPTQQVRDDAFAWTVCYQVLGWNEREVSQKFSQPHKTVANGIDRILAILGLEKQCKKPGRKPGRRLGTKKLSDRRAIEDLRFRRTVKAISKLINEGKGATYKATAEQIGINASRFGADWVPDVLRQARERWGTTYSSWERLVQKVKEMSP